MAAFPSPLQSLKSVFGYGSFRPLQAEIIRSSLEGRDVLAILPTGGGKSLCYQLPALHRDGLTLVVSPLIALMKDQVDQLQAAGVAATFLNSSLSASESRARIEGLKAGRYKLLYLAPERLFLPEFMERLKRWRVAALAIDEAHCISEWGHDFRPEYRQLADIRTHFPGIPVIALTATATDRVRDDIERQLRLKAPLRFVASFNRPNLNYRVLPKDRPRRQVLDYVEGRRDQSGIVYCQSRRAAEEHAITLREAGHKALAYHAGLPQVERITNQEAFIRDDVQVICATIAFGMGINKPNVRYVLHADLPKNIESYYQETGRAGRDGLPSECLLLFSAGDIAKYRFFIDQIEDTQAAQVARKQLRQMADFAEYADCRRGALLRYFGESPEDEQCGNCDNCEAGHEMVDVTDAAQKLLSCVYRINQSGHPMGLGHTIDVLRGSKKSKVCARRHDQLSTHGIGKDQPAAYWQWLGKQLIQKGYLRLSQDGYDTVELGAEAGDALRKRSTLRLRQAAVATRAPAQPERQAGSVDCDEGLFEVLRKLRKELADSQGVPPYVVFGDVSLRWMARRYPRGREAFLAIPGVGERKLEAYGEAFLQSIRAWTAEHAMREFPDNEATAPARRRRPPRDAGPNATERETLRLYESGLTVEAIAAERGLQTTTIEGHLAACIEAGRLGDCSGLISDAETERVRQAASGHGYDTLRPIHEALGGTMDYGKIRLAVARIRSPGKETQNPSPSGNAQTLSI